MLTVTNTFGSRQVITQKDVLKVAKGALDSVLQDMEDHSLDTGVGDQLRDSIFFGGRKQTTLSTVHDLSYHTAALNLEFEKPIEKRNQQLIVTHVRAICDSRQMLGELHPGESLEFGTERGRPVVGKESYLIHRCASRLNPLGIALYQRGEKTVDIPSFKSVNDITVKDIQAIRSCCKLRCEGQKYQIHFDEINRPNVSCQNMDHDWLMIQTKLVCLFYKHQEQFALPKSQYLEARPKGFVSVLDRAPIRTDPAPVPLSEFDSDGAPTFERWDDIHDCHFGLIRSNEKLRCQGKEYSVKFDKEYEPILLCDSDDSCAELIQTRLTGSWIRRRAMAAKEQVTFLPKPEATLPLAPILLALEDAGCEALNESESDIQALSWYVVGNEVIRRFNDIVNLFSRKLAAEKVKLFQELDRLAAQENPTSKHHKMLKDEIEKIALLAVNQDTVNGNVENLKKIYMHQFSLLKTSIGSEVMQRIIRGRIGNLTICFETFAKSDMAQEAINRFNALLSIQVEFIKNFNTSQILSCISSLKPNATISVEATSGTACKIPVRAMLTDLLGEPTTPWEEIADGMKKLEVDQAETAKKLALQLKTAEKLGLEMAFIRVSFTHGAEPSNGESIYIPEIYSRIVSCKALCAKLLDTEVFLSRQDVDAIEAEFRNHLRPILEQTRQFSEKEKGFTFCLHRLYRPLRNGSGSLMNYAQYSAQQKKPPPIQLSQGIRSRPIRRRVNA